jgi:hypothetical protein
MIELARIRLRKVSDNVDVLPLIYRSSPLDDISA